MALFTYNATDSTGRLIKGSLEAADEKALVCALQGMGYLPINIGKASKGERVNLFSFKRFTKGISGSDVTNFTHELSSMLEAGLPLDRSISILSELERNEGFKKILDHICKGLRGGSTFAECLEKYPHVFSEIYVSTIKAGEAGGALEAVLARLKKFMEDTQRLKDDIKSALLYPLLLTVVGGSAVLMMLLFVIPRFSVIFSDTGGIMPLPTRMLLFISNAVAGYWWVGLGLAAALIYFLKLRMRTEDGRVWMDRSLLRVPLIGIIIRKASVTRFSRTLGTLLQGGLPIIEALAIAIKTMGNLSIARQMEPVIEGVRKGKGMALPLKETDAFPPLAVHMLTVGEETGKLDEMLIKLADNYDRDISTAIKRLLALLEPGIILVMAVVVGFLVISLLLAIFSLNDMPL